MFEAIGLLTVIIIISIVIASDEPVTTAQTQISANITNDPSMFFHWPSMKITNPFYTQMQFRISKYNFDIFYILLGGRQLIFLTSYFVGRIIGIAVSILLLIGVKKVRIIYESNLYVNLSASF